MSLAPEALMAAAESETGLSDYGSDSFREGLDRLTAALEGEAELNEMGLEIMRQRLVGHLARRLGVHETIRQCPAIAEEEIRSPIFIIGLPRTGTTALSNLVSLDPQIRSLRMWESSNPVPPPEEATQDVDPRIEQAELGLTMMNEMFPEMRSLHFQTATGPTECQDLLGMEFRTTHFDGMAHVPSYTAWAMGCDMVPAYRQHRRTLQLLQWHCPPRLWHLKTPVHMLSLDDMATAYPDAKFLWTHRHPAKVLASVCYLIAYCRSWVSERDDAIELGEQQVRLWAEALRRALDFRDRMTGEGRVADVFFGDLNTDPVKTIEAAYDAIGLTMDTVARERMNAWGVDNARGTRGTHEYRLDQFGLDAAGVSERFAPYIERFGLEESA